MLLDARQKRQASTSFTGICIYESSLGVTWPLSRPSLSAMWHGLGLGLGATWVTWFNHSETQS